MSYINHSIKAPFDKENLAALIKRQADPKVSRYICPEHGGNGIFHFTPTKEGLLCEECMHLETSAPREIYVIKSAKTGKMEKFVRYDDDKQKSKKQKKKKDEAAAAAAQKSNDG